MSVSIRERVAHRVQQARSPAPRASATAAQARITEAAVVPGGWFGGWLGVSPYWWNNRGDQGGRRMGVTDGSDALPGEIGEFIQFGQTVPLPTAQTTFPLVMGALGAGDWDCWVHCTTNIPLGNLMFVLNPVPLGFSDNMSTVAWVPGTTELLTQMSNIVRALIAEPVVISFDISTAANMGTNLIFWFNARRMR